MRYERLIARLDGLEPKVIDAKIRGVLAGKVDVDSPDAKEELNSRATLVTDLAEAGLWPLGMKKRPVVSRSEPSDEC